MADSKNKMIMLIVIGLVVAGAYYFFFMTPTATTSSPVMPMPPYNDTVTPTPTGPRPTSAEECSAMGGNPLTWKSCGGVNYCCDVCKGIHDCSENSGLHDCACNE